MKTKLNTQLWGIFLGIFLLSTSLFAKEDSFGCDIRSMGIYSQSCEPDGSYTLCLAITGDNLPTTPGDLKLVIGHETIDWEFDYELVNLDGSLARICVNIFGEDRTNLDVFVRLESGCTFTAYNFYNEPTCEPAPPCIITDFTARTPSCLYYDVYEVIFDVVGENLPENDSDVAVKIDGIAYQVTRYDRNPSGTEAEVWVTVLRDTNEDVDVNIELASGCSLTKQDLFDEPDCGDLPVCNITDFTARTPSCLYYDVYEVIFDITGENLPTSDNDIEVEIDGTSYQVTRYERVSDTEAEIWVTVLRDLAQDVDVTISLTSDCSLTKQDVYDEPDCGDLPVCSISDFTARTPSCLYYDVYEVIFDVTGENLPTSDNDIEVEIDGVSYQVTRYERTSDTEAEVWVTVLRDLAQDVDVTISLTSDCSLTKQDVYDEPDCGDLPVCNITDFSARTPSCLYYDVYEVIFDITGENLPASDNDIVVEIDGVSYQVTRYNRASDTEAEVWVTVLRDLAQDVDVTISLTNDCSLTKQDVYDEPDCGDLPTCSISDFSARTPSCLYYDVYEVIFDVTGENLPTSDSDIEVEIDGTSYQVTRYTRTSDTEAEVWVTVLRDLQEDVDVTITLNEDCSLTKQDVYDEPDCGDDPSSPQGDCDITSMSFVNVECLPNNTYNLCFRIEGSYFPEDIDQLKVVVDHQPYPVYTYNRSGSFEDMGAVICVYGIEGNGEQDIEVFVQLGSGCSFTARDLFDEPDCNNARLGHDEINDINIYPNPNNGQFSVEIPNMGEATLNIIDQMGRNVYRQNVQGNAVEKIQLSQFPEGIYFVRIRHKQGVLTKRVMIKN